MATDTLSRGVPASHAPKLEPTRGALISAAGLAGIAAAIPAAAASIYATPAAKLIAELDAFDSDTRALEANPLATDAQWDAWQERQGALYRRVVALRATRENVTVKVRAVRSIYMDQTPFVDCEPTTTDEELARHIVRALVEGA